MTYKIGVFLFLTAIIASCSEQPKPRKTKGATSNTMENKDEKAAWLANRHLVDDIPIHDWRKYVHVVIEIPAGSREKWEVNKISGRIERDSIDGKPRTIDYSGYPANYGFIPGTLLSKEKGGDGDPLDVIVLGDTLKRGDVVSCNPIGVLKLKDRGEQDDKLIVVLEDTPYENHYELESLEAVFPGTKDRLETWFVNYKGPGKMISEGFLQRAHALRIIEEAENQYNESTKK